MSFYVHSVIELQNPHLSSLFTLLYLFSPPQMAFWRRVHYDRRVRRHATLSSSFPLFSLFLSCFPRLFAVSDLIKMLFVSHAAAAAAADWSTYLDWLFDTPLPSSIDWWQSARLKKRRRIIIVLKLWWLVPDSGGEWGVLYIRPPIGYVFEISQSIQRV